MTDQIWTVVVHDGVRSLVEICQRNGMVWVRPGLSVAELQNAILDLAGLLHQATQSSPKEPV